MTDQCKTIVFSDKAYNAIIDETFKKDPIETGGILLGHVLSNGYWIVMEVVPPGRKSTHEWAYFEYDEDFVNYLAESIATKYATPLTVLGLWHRHPGSMDYFSNTDNGTNLTFAELNTYGAISGLVNVDPAFRLTMRHVSSPLHYEIVEFEVGDDLIPEEYFRLSQYPDKGLHPQPHKSKKAKETVAEDRQESAPSSAGLLPSQPANRHRGLRRWLLPLLAAYALIVTGCLVFGRCHSVSEQTDKKDCLKEKCDTSKKEDEVKKTENDTKTLNIKEEKNDSTEEKEAPDDSLLPAALGDGEIQG